MINYLTEMNKIKTLIASSSEITDNNKIVTGFGTGIVPTPLKSLYTVIKPIELKIERISQDDLDASNLAKFTIGINIHKAEKLDPSELLDRFSKIIDLIDNSEDLTLLASGFGELQRNADTNSICLPAFITLAYYYY